MAVTAQVPNEKIKAKESIFATSTVLRVARYALVRLFSLLVTVVIAIYLTILIANLGGYVDVSTDGYQILHRTAVFAPPPYKESMKMFVFPNAKDFTPQPWVGRDVSTYFTVYFDILNAFDNFEPVYDLEIIGDHLRPPCGRPAATRATARPPAAHNCRCYCRQ